MWRYRFCLRNICPNICTAFYPFLSFQLETPQIWCRLWILLALSKFDHQIASSLSTFSRCNKCVKIRLDATCMKLVNKMFWQSTCSRLVIIKLEQARLTFPLSTNQILTNAKIKAVVPRMLDAWTCLVHSIVFVMLDFLQKQAEHAKVRSP